MRIIESKSEDSLEDLDEWHDVTEKLDIPEKIINSYILYKTVQRNRNKRALTHFQYRKMLVDQFVGDFRQDRTRVSTSISDVRLNRKLHIIRKGVKRDCVVYSKRKEKRMADVKRVIIITLAQVNPECTWEIVSRYHTMANYKI